MIDAAPSGVILLDKPLGLSSNRAMGQVKTLLNLPRRGKAGYLGTLDPLASGVLPIFIGKATKLISAFEHLDKTYRVTIRLGQETDTLDAEGEVTVEKSLDGMSVDSVRDAIVACGGEFEQRVPEYSALKINGVPAYKLAREGRKVPQRHRQVRIWGIEIESLALPEATFTLTCTAGTYVRALARDLGAVLGVGGHVVALRRLACGTLFPSENSFTLDRIAECLSKDDRHWLVNPAVFLPNYQSLTVEELTERQLREGRAVPLTEDLARLCPATKIKALRPCGTLIAVGEVVANDLGGLGFKPTKVLV